MHYFIVLDKKVLDTLRQHRYNLRQRDTLRDTIKEGGEFSVNIKSLREEKT